MRIGEIGLDGKERWHIDGIQNPWDAQVLAGDRVLIAEFQAGRVTERNFKGDVLWERSAQNPIGCQRLINGNTFIICRNQLVEVTRDGKEVFKHDRPDYGIMGAYKLRNGKIIMFTNNGMSIRMDANGKEEKSFSVGHLMWGGGGDVLPNGHVLMPQWNGNKVVEYDQDGKVVWEAAFQWPSSASRLPNGNTLVASQNNNKIVEFNRKRTISNNDLERMKKLIADLGDDSFEVRQNASAQLVVVGAAAIPLLKQAAKDTDIEVVRRAEDCLKHIETGSSSSIVAAA